MALEPGTGPRASCVVAVGAQLEGGDIADLRGWNDLNRGRRVSHAVPGDANPHLPPVIAQAVRRAPAPVRDALLVEAEGASEIPEPGWSPR